MFYLLIKIYGKRLIKKQSLLIEEKQIWTNYWEAIASSKTELYVKSHNNQNNQDTAHHASQDWTIFVVNKGSKPKHSKVTGQNLSNISQPNIQNWKPNLSTPMSYMSTLVRKKWDFFQYPSQ